jgi:large subunit ribosomal protein L30
MATLQIKQVRSSIGQTIRQKQTLRALGLRKINHIVEHQDVPQIIGMINKVKHLVTVNEINK